MLPRINRITKKNDFDAVFKGGRTIRADFLIVKLLKNDLSVSRLGFVISKKISTKAVVRNKIKRRLRSLFNKELYRITLPQDIIVVTLPGIEKLDFARTEVAVKKIFKNNP